MAPRLLLRERCALRRVANVGDSTAIHCDVLPNLFCGCRRDRAIRIARAASAFRECGRNKFFFLCIPTSFVLDPNISRTIMVRWLRNRITSSVVVRRCTHPAGRGAGGERTNGWTRGREKEWTAAAAGRLDVDRITRRQPGEFPNTAAPTATLSVSVPHMAARTLASACTGLHVACVCSESPRWSLGVVLSSSCGGWGRGERQRKRRPAQAGHARKVGWERRVLSSGLAQARRLGCRSSQKVRDEDRLAVCVDVMPAS